MRLIPKVKLGPRLLGIALHFVDLGAIIGTLQPGDRTVEYPFVLVKILPAGGGRVLDIGCTAKGNYLATTLARLGWDVHGIDLWEPKLELPNFHFVKGDIRHTNFPDDHFDWVYAVSTLDHVGVSGRYGVIEDDPEGDFKAADEIRRILRPGGTLLVTVPCGSGRFYHRLHSTRLKEVFSKWTIKEEVYYLRDDKGTWHAASEEAAGEAEWAKNPALALLELDPAK